MDFVTLKHKTLRGKNKIAETRKRCPKWDSAMWRVLRESARVLFSTEPGPWLHVVPDTDEYADWASRWVHLKNDVDFMVTPNI